MSRQPRRDDSLSDPARAPADWEDRMRASVRGSFVVLGMGNRDRGDDGAGCFVAQQLAARGLGRALDCGTAPENCVGRVEALRPSHVVFVDAADLGLSPGAVAFLPAQELPTQSVSTHCAGLGPLVEFLEAGCGAACWLLAIQPSQLALRQGLSPAVRQAVDLIAGSPVWRELPG